MEHGSQIQDEQHLVWFARVFQFDALGLCSLGLTLLFESLDYELGRLYDLRRETELAKQEYSLVLSGKIPEMSRKKGSGKVSLQVSTSLA